MNLEAEATLAFLNLPQVVRIDLNDDDTGVNIIVRTSESAPAPELIEHATEWAAARKGVTVQIAPELNWIPLTISEDSEYFEYVRAIMIAVEPYRLVVAAWFEPPQEGEEEEEDDRCTVYLYGDSDPVLFSVLARNGLKVQTVERPEQVPKTAGCIFNEVTRLITAQAAGDAAGADAVRERMKLTSLAPKKADDAPVRRVPCRWCEARILPSSHPQHSNQCPECGALQAAVTIPTKGKEIPYLQIFINPDRSLFFDLIHAPPQPTRLDLSKVWRYTVSSDASQEFLQNPMGHKELLK